MYDKNFIKHKKKTHVTDVVQDKLVEIILNFCEMNVNLYDDFNNHFADFNELILSIFIFKFHAEQVLYIDLCNVIHNKLIVQQRRL